MRISANSSPARPAGCTLYEIDPRTGQTIEIFFADSVVAQSFGARGAGFYWRRRDCSSDAPSGPFIVGLDAYRSATQAMTALMTVG